MTKTVKVECSACDATGLYRGMAERRSVVAREPGEIERARAAVDDRAAALGALIGVVGS